MNDTYDIKIMPRNLPEYCYALLPSNGQLIRINRGESGYLPIKVGITQEHVFGEEAKTLMDVLNNAGHINYSQREAMLAGSMFGWDIPAADPAHPCNQPPYTRN